MMTTNRWPELSHVRRPQSALWLQKWRVMFFVGSCQQSDSDCTRPHFSSLVISWCFSLSLSPLCVCYKVSSQLEANAALSSSLHARFSHPVALARRAVIPACQSGPERPVAHEVRERSTVVYVWPLSSAAGGLLVQMHRTQLDLSAQ